ncbi:MAG: tyrosine-type recombinase/integrase, partial [Deltaproteobacteria bacterium]|nr:tyrosine-type recombinase/integrase [Deltaproteobacteria bacterium]
PINLAIKPILKRLMKENRESEYLFVNPKTGSRFTSIKNGWDGILAKVVLKGKPGVDKLRFHDLRHTAATNLAWSGKDMKFIAQYLEHSEEGAEILARVPTESKAPKLKAL